MAVLQELLKLSLAFVVIAGGFLGLSLGLEWYYRTPLEKFCDSIPVDVTIEAIHGAAKEEGFFVFELAPLSESLSILNHRSFTFRYGCKIEFANGRPISHEFFVAD